jgi:hypothetical protein
MRSMLKRPAVRIGLAILLAVILVGAGLGAYSQATAFSYADLKDALRARGATVQETGTIASTVTFQGAGHGLTMNGAQVEVYEYGTTIAAQLDAARVSSDGATFRHGFGPFGGQAVTVDWIAPPHHYRRGRVIVTYIGQDAGILQLLTAVLGPQFAGGGAIPHGNGYSWFIERLRASGATVELVQYRPSTPIFLGTEPPTNRYVIGVNGTVVSAFEFADDQAAAAYASHVSGGDYVDPLNHQGIIVDYAAPPHFFRRFTLIVLYVGNDAQVIQLLTSVLGPPFAEGHV